MKNRGISLLAAALFLLMGIGSAQAAPDRFDNQIPDAVPDPENSYNFSFNLLNVNTEGPITSERSTHQRLRLGYQFSEKLNASFHINTHDLANGIGLTSPIFSNLDSAQSYGLKLEMNLLNEAATPAGPDNNPAWIPGSAFSIGFLGNVYDLDRSGVGEQETELGAFLAYSTDLTEEMRGHTYFSTARLTGDNSSGSLNRVGAGLDYLLQEGERPLILMANGMIDIYNFRQPQFNTSRISRFDLGLRYKMSRQWDAQLGWSTFNDSEQDSSGSGLFAGINWRSIKDPCHCGSCSDCSVLITVEENPAEQRPPAQAMADPAIVAAAQKLTWDPADTPMMDLDYPQNYNRDSVEQGLLGKAEIEEAPTRSMAFAELPDSVSPDNQPGNSPDDDNGIAIPTFPTSEPHLAASAELMVRPGHPVNDFGGTESIVADIETEPLVPAGQTELDSVPQVGELQSFAPRLMPDDAQLSRAPARVAEAHTGSDGIADACSRFLFLRLASLPRWLLASGG